MSVPSRAYWVREAGRGELREAALPDDVPAGALRVRALASAISAGTERLVGCGLVPERMATRMRCPGMAGSFSLPVKYGYCLVGDVIDGPRAGERVFALHPHEEIADVEETFATPLPADLPARRATLYANLETATNAVWDAQVVKGERVLVLGLGLVGLLVAARLRACGVDHAELCDADRGRLEDLQNRVPWLEGARCKTPAEVEGGSYDVAIHASGNPAGLRTALRALAAEGRVIEVSWFGAREVSLPLGEDFHDRRLSIRSSQVAGVAPGHTREERSREVLTMLQEQGELLDPLLGADIPFDALPETMAKIYSGQSPFPHPVIRYP